MRICVILIITVALIGTTEIVAAKDTISKMNCSQYFGKGYCVDHIKNKTGYKQNGDAITWKSNINKQDVQAGDVAIFKIGRYGHVAYVERVYSDNNYKPVEVHISEMNWDSPLDSCGRSDRFNIVTYRILKLEEVWGFWRPFEIKLVEIQGVWNGHLISVDKSGREVKTPLQIVFHKLTDTTFNGNTSEVSQLSEHIKTRKLKLPLKIIEGQYNSSTRMFSFSVKDPFFWGRGNFNGIVVNKSRIDGEYRYSYENDGKFVLNR